METTIEILDNQTEREVSCQSKINKNNDAREKRKSARLKILYKERFNVAKAIKERERFGKNDDQTRKLYAQLIKIEKKISLVNSSRVPTLKTNISIINN
ncbi:MAG: hypothetical protein NTU98_07915 [Bacteroidetes bacterium]|nr:hypothetical protein [Bacteroidota bacterium]